MAYLLLGLGRKVGAPSSLQYIIYIPTKSGLLGSDTGIQAFEEATTGTPGKEDIVGSSP